MSGCFLINSSGEKAVWFSILLVLSYVLVCTSPWLELVAGQLKGYFCWLFLIRLSLMILHRTIFLLIFGEEENEVFIVDSFLVLQIGVSA